MIEKIQREQGPEIVTMQAWLDDWNARNAGSAMSLEQAQGIQGLFSLDKAPAPSGYAASRVR